MVREEGGGYGWLVWMVREEGNGYGWLERQAMGMDG